MKRLYLTAATLASLVMACGEKEKEYDATGTFETIEVTVSAKSSGELVSFEIEEGQTVKLDDVVGNIESTQLVLQKNMLDTQRAQLDASNTQLDANKKVFDAGNAQLDANNAQLDANIKNMEAGKQKINFNKTATAANIQDMEVQLGVIRQQITNQQKELQRYTELFNDGAVAKKQVDDINYNISVLEKQLAATKSQIEKANNSLKAQLSAIDMDKIGLDAQIEGVVSQKAGTNAQKAGNEAQKAGVEAQKASITSQHSSLDVQQAQIEDLISNTVVKAPLSGLVLEKYVERGEYMSPGKPMFKIADMRNMILRAYVTSSQLEHIKVGQKVTVMTDYGNNQGKTYPGTITWIAGNAEFTPKTIVTEDERADLVYAVKIAVKNDGGIKIGMYGKMKF